MSLAARTLFLYSDDQAVTGVLKTRAAAYLAGGQDSGFDLEVYAPYGTIVRDSNGEVIMATSNSPSYNAPLVMLPTRVHAKVVRDEHTIPSAQAVYSTGGHIVRCYEAFLLLARSSLPLKGWMLGNSIGLIDIKYADELKGIFVATSMQSQVWSESLQGQRCVQIVSSTFQPFDHVVVLETRTQWDEIVADSGGDRGGGFGSTDRRNAEVEISSAGAGAVESNTDNMAASS